MTLFDDSFAERGARSAMLAKKSADIPSVMEFSVGRVRYQCNEKAETIALTLPQDKGPLYYPAYRTHGVILICPIPISREAALEILKENSDRKGVFTTKSSYARGLCDSLGGWRQDFRYEEGYWNHYHPNAYPEAHVWYVW